MQPDPTVPALEALQGTLGALERQAHPPEARTWAGPRNLPKPDARKRRLAAARDSRRRNRA